MDHYIPKRRIPVTLWSDHVPGVQGSVFLDLDPAGNRHQTVLEKLNESTRFLPVAVGAEGRIHLFNKHRLARVTAGRQVVATDVFARGFLPWRDLVFDPSRSRDYLVQANWALYCDNYLEGFHIPYVHGGLAQAIDYANYRCEVFPWSTLQLGLVQEGVECFALPAGHPDHGSRVGAYYWWLFPNTMLNLYPWGVSLNVVPREGDLRPQLVGERELVDRLEKVDHLARLGIAGRRLVVEPDSREIPRPGPRRDQRLEHPRRGPRGRHELHDAPLARRVLVQQPQSLALFRGDAHDAVPHPAPPHQDAPGRRRAQQVELPLRLGGLDAALAQLIEILGGERPIAHGVTILPEGTAGSPRETTTAAARSPVTLSVVRHMSRKRSTPRMIPIPSVGTPTSPRMIAITGSDPPGTPAVPIPARMQIPHTKAWFANDRSTP